MTALLLAALLAQVTPVQPIVKGTGLPPPAATARETPPQGSDEAAAMAPVQALLAGIAARDGTAAIAHARTDGTLTAAVERPDGTHDVRRMTWADFAAQLKPGPQRYEERLLDPAVEVDGDVAMVWSPYVFLIDGRPDHCGADLFDVVRDGGRWKVLNVTWSQRSTGCSAG